MWAMIGVAGCAVAQAAVLAWRERLHKRRLEASEAEAAQAVRRADAHGTRQGAQFMLEALKEDGLVCPALQAEVFTGTADEVTHWYDNWLLKRAGIAPLDPPAGHFGRQYGANQDEKGEKDSSG